MNNKYKKTIDKIKFSESSKEQLKQNLKQKETRPLMIPIVRIASFILISFVGIGLVLSSINNINDEVFTLEYGSEYYQNIEDYNMFTSNYDLTDYKLSFELTSDITVIKVLDIETVISDMKVYSILKVEAIKSSNVYDLKVLGGIVEAKELFDIYSYDIEKYDNERFIKIQGIQDFDIKEGELYGYKSDDLEPIKLFEVRESSEGYEFKNAEENIWIEIVE